MPPTQRDQSVQVAKESNERYIAGLLDELDTYRRSNRPEHKERAKQVEAEIRRCGGKVPAAGSRHRRSDSVEPTVVPEVYADDPVQAGAEHLEDDTDGENLGNAPLAEDVEAGEVEAETAKDAKKDVKPPPAKQAEPRRRIGGSAK